ncbi:MAG: kinase/pyrophosphorylase [Tissierellales bacterium]|jgi:[pyruvate, water dikinase]-phosphate phosphotransferase / [pyruvate, water dikinase] kinase|nr:kinase/pyrophosphorylase [Tissierellales bacterium]MBN2826744.1 kinase/pyrophosphorylase [Tissierellales bacterium]
MLENNKAEIFVVSDSIGETAELVAQAAKIQFNDTITEIRKFSFVLDTDQMDEIIEMAKGKKCLILYTLVMSEEKLYFKKAAEDNNIIAIDLLGPIIKKLEILTGVVPKREAGLNRRLTSYYFDKIEAIEFAVKYDDGKDPRGFRKADVVLIGVSRTSKTPLSMYLANKNLKVANLPLVPEVEPSEELFKISPKKIIGLTNSPEILNTIRRERLKDMGVKHDSVYADLDRIIQELEYADKIFSRLRCPVIDVSQRAIEETASIIVSIISNIR